MVDATMSITLCLCERRCPFDTCSRQVQRRQDTNNAQTLKLNQIRVPIIALKLGLVSLSSICVVWAHARARIHPFYFSTYPRESNDNDNTIHKVFPIKFHKPQLLPDVAMWTLAVVVTAAATVVVVAAKEMCAHWNACICLFASITLFYASLPIIDNWKCKKKKQNRMKERKMKYSLRYGWWRSKNRNLVTMCSCHRSFMHGNSWMA